MSNTPDERFLRGGASGVDCPNCDSPIPFRELEDGWCEACGKPIPLHVRDRAGAGSSETPQRERQKEPEPTPPPPPSPSKKRWLFLLFPVVAVALLAWGYHFYHRSNEVSDRRRAEENEIRHKRQMAGQIHPLFDGKLASAEAVSVPLRDKILVWNWTTNKEEDAVWELLDQGRRARSTDPSMTVIMILDWKDALVTSYDVEDFDSKLGLRRRASKWKGFQRTLIVGVVDWPERRVLAKFQLQGEMPPDFVTRKPDERGHVVGDVAIPLFDWISSQPRERGGDG